MAHAMSLAPALFFEAHLKSAGLVWDPDTGTVRKRKNGGAKIVGFSREGVARVSKHDDLEAQRRATNDLWDRMFGKARQSMELAGGGSGMAMITIPQTADRAKAVSKVLIESGAFNLQISTDDGESLDV